MENMRSYIEGFVKKLETVSAENISPEQYCIKYLDWLLRHKHYYLSIYADVLNKVTRHCGKPKEHCILIDFGSGNGLLGIFAAYCGFKHVALVDYDEKFINASRALAQQLAVKQVSWVSGDARSLHSILKNGIPDAIIGTDVIEHIYDPGIFLLQLKQVNPDMVSVFTTGSNPSNYFKVRSLQKIQLKDEFEGGVPADHQLFGEKPLEPFMKTRERIIRQHFTSLADSDILKLAVSTRGMNEADIIRSVNTYISQGLMPKPAAGTNTCNPMNGSWTERILPLPAYVTMYRAAGFTCRFYAGFYNEYEKGIKGIVKKLLNGLIVVFGKRISPYIVIVGSKN